MITSDASYGKFFFSWSFFFFPWSIFIYNSCTEIHHLFITLEFIFENNTVQWFLLYS